MKDRKKGNTANLYPSNRSCGRERDGMRSVHRNDGVIKNKKKIVKYARSMAKRSGKYILIDEEQQREGERKRGREYGNETETKISMNNKMRDSVAREEGDDEGGERN